MSGYWEEQYGVAPIPKDPAAAQPGDPNVTPHIGPVVEDYAAINEKLKKIDAARVEHATKGKTLPEVTEVPPRKPWWQS